MKRHRRSAAPVLAQPPAASDYWTDASWLAHDANLVWRTHADAIHTRLLERWCGPERRIPGTGTVLKTDLYEEAVGNGQTPWLEARFARTLGMDISAEVVAAAQRKHPALEAEVADARDMGFPDAMADWVVSLSTLDHFNSTRDIERSIFEIRRVLKPGGYLLLTLDNPLNPFVGLRQALPFALLKRLGLVPYFCGATLRPGRLVRLLTAVGFEIVDRCAVMHCPRVLAVKLAQRASRSWSPEAKRRLASALIRWEVLDRLPTRYLTGHFSAVLARQPICAPTRLSRFVPDKVAQGQQRAVDWNERIDSLELDKPQPFGC